MKERVLIVDDEPDIVEIIKKRFESRNYEVKTASNGEECIKIIEQYHPHVVIMDVIMPKMSGGDTVRWLRAQQETKAIPVLFLTALAAFGTTPYNSPVIKIDGEFFPAMSKPFDSKELVLEAEKLIRMAKQDS